MQVNQNQGVSAQANSDSNGNGESGHPNRDGLVANSGLNGMNVNGSHLANNEPNDITLLNNRMKNLEIS